MPDNPYIMGDSFLFDRPELALSNLLAGDIGGAGRSLWDPGTLPPEKRRKLADRLGLTGGWASLVEITTNPMVLIGLALTLTHKLPRAGDLMPFVEGESKVIARTHMLEKIFPEAEVFRGTKVPALLEATTRRYLRAHSDWQEPLTKAIRNYTETVGHDLTPPEMLRLSAYLDDLGNPANPVWTKLISRTKDNIERVAKAQAGLGNMPQNVYADPLSGELLELKQVQAAQEALRNPLPGLVIDTPLQQLGEDVRGVFNRIHENLFADRRNSAEILQMLSRLKGMTGRVNLKRDLPLEQIEKYLPHIAVMTPEERTGLVFQLMRETGADGLMEARGAATREWAAAQRAGLMNESRAHERAMRDQANRQATKSAVKRRDIMLPDPEDLKALGASDDLIRLVLSARQAEDNPFYSLKFDKVWEYYSNAAARTYAWTVPESEHVAGFMGRVTPEGEPLGPAGYGKRLLDEAELMEAPQDPVGIAKGRLLRSVYLPITMGGMTVDQATHATAWAQSRQVLINHLGKGPVSDFLDKAGAKALKGKLIQWIASDPVASYPGMGRAISSFFYHTTIGGNPLSAAYNLLQPLVTLPAIMPLKYVQEGYLKTASGLFDYYKLRTGLTSAAEVGKRWKGFAKTYAAGGRLEARDALQAVFPEFYTMHQELEPLYRSEFADIVEGSFQRAFQAPAGVRRALDKGQKALMFMFMEAEQSNRLVSFYSARAQGLAELPGKPFYNVLRNETQVLGAGTDEARASLSTAANEYASSIVGMTQFGSGPLQKPSGLVGWWPPFSQFATYPTRMAGFIAGPAWRHKAILGRGLMATGLLYGLGKEALGSDISRGLLFGGIPQATDTGAFAPLPIVPPLLQAAGSMGMAIAKGSTQPLRETLPLLVPGGIPLARAAGMVPGGAGVSQFIGRPYADYQNRTPDGRIPVYTSEGSLIGYYTTAQLYSRALGFGGQPKQAEQAVTTYLLKQRDYVRGLKRDVMQALYEGDAEHVLTLAQQYQSAFPRWGSLPIGPGEIRALHMRRDVSRIERLLETMPAQLRGEYVQMISAALGQNYPAILGLGGPGLTSGPIIEREPYRAVGAGETGARVSQGLHGVSLQDKIRSEGHDATRAVHDRSQFGFSPFGEF